MKIKTFLIAIMTAIIAFSCNHKDINHDADYDTESEKLKITSYSENFELFAEADPFVAGDTSNVLSHFSFLSNFKAIENGSITIRLIVGTKEVSQTLQKPTRKGIFSFNLKPETTGSGQLIFDIKTPEISDQIIVPGIIVYAEKNAANDAAKKLLPSQTNTIVFTKEQSWKIDFETSPPTYEPFGQVIKTTAQVQSAQSDVTIVAAKSEGIVLFTGKNILEGVSVASGQSLFTITSSGLANNNSTIRYIEAQNNYNKAKANYDRLKELSADKIVSEKDLLSAKTEYENAKVVFEIFSKNFSVSGQSVTCPESGYLKQLFVTNGQFVQLGQPLISVTKNKTLILQADVQQKYAPLLGSISTANIRTLQDNRSYSLDELNGKVLSYGKTTNDDNFLIPVSLQIDNIGSFISGGFVELYLKTLSKSNALTVPITALLEEQGTYSVLVQINPELFEKREVSIGTSDGLKAEIVKGISRQERIVTKGAVLVKLAQATGTLDAHSGHVH